MKRIRLSENDLVKVIKKVLSENEQPESNKGKKEPPKPRCIPENIIPLDEIVGQADEYVKYSPGITKRRNLRRPPRRV